MNLSELITKANLDPERSRFKLVLYKEDGLCWVRRGEAEVPMGKATKEPATIERLMELVHTLPPRSMRTERDAHLIEIESIAERMQAFQKAEG